LVIEVTYYPGMPDSLEQRDGLTGDGVTPRRLLVGEI
jgi:hypothetical protein